MGEWGKCALLPLFFVERRGKMLRDWDIITSYVDSVTTSIKTVTFPKVQEQVKVKNQGNANITYTIGAQSGTLTPGQSVTVNESVSSFTIQSVSGVQSFELRSVEKGTEQTETETGVMSLLSDIAKQVPSNTSKLKSVCVPIYLSSNTTTFKNSILNSKNKGANFVIISIKYDQAQTDSTMTANTNNAGLQDVITYCKGLGMGIAVKIHVGASGGFGTNLAPSNVATWFTNYKAACLSVAATCNSNGVTYLGISNELYTMTNANKDKWQDIHNSIKSAYPSIQTFISVNKAEYASCLIYDVVDVIGFNFYPSLTTNGKTETDLNIRKGFYNGLDGLNLIDMVSSLKKTYNKPLWITEAGCAAHSDALSATYLFDFTGYAGSYDQETQKVYYQYMFDIVWNLSSIDCLSIWAIGGANSSTNLFAFEGATSEAVVVSYWGGA